MDIEKAQQQQRAGAEAAPTLLPVIVDHQRASDRPRPVCLFQGHFRCFHKKPPISSVPYADVSKTHAAKRPLFRAFHDFVINNFLPSVALAKDGVSPLPRPSSISRLQIQEIHVSPGFNLNQLTINHLSNISPHFQRRSLVPNRA